MPAVRNAIVVSFWSINSAHLLLTKHMSRVPTSEPIIKEETVSDEILQERIPVN